MYKMEQKTQKLTKKQKDFLEIYEKNMCLVTLSCKNSNITRKTYYRWLDNQTFKDSVEESQTNVKDFGENALFQLIKEKNPAAVIFFNKCKNKERGYVEKQEIEHMGVQNIQINIPEEVKELL